MINPMQLIQLMRSGGNPQEALNTILQKEAGNNPVLNNAIQMMKNGDSTGIERLARNLCEERHIDPDKALSQLKNQFGMK
ncbi:hypothetical protein [Clostridium sp. AF24-2LB]|jgi:hypothetical protein|uniref:hypothetical protein n=1 Tax=Clostridium sp. AF24-2LB TaxID=2293007 RepID=UPI000E4EBB81|nr:hypothetical protein [Clostridium sp. AF24-2LB]RHQ65215.1 hypothetical protein DWY27_13005 [Clostridium sp. AF24-2LB]